MMRKHKSSFFLVVILLLLVLACNLPSTKPDTPLNEVDINATLTSIALARNDPTTASPVQPADAPTITITPMIPLTNTPTIPMVNVSTATNCRKGPGIVYEYLTGLLVGEKAEVVGKYTATTPPYWVVKIDSYTCWLWGEYATVEGNTSSLPEMTPPPTPTPTVTNTPTSTATPVPSGPAFSLSFDGLANCSAGDDYAVLKWTNAGSVVFQSAKVEIKDLNTSLDLYGLALSNSPFGATSPGCGAGNSSLDLASTAYAAYYIGSPAPSGHNIRISATLCSQDGAAGDCVTRSVDATLP